MNTVENEIISWLENRGYDWGFIYVGSYVSMRISTKISPEDMEDFKQDFGQEISLEGASYKNHGKIKEFEYYCGHELLDEFRKSVITWVNNKSFPFDHAIVTSSISLYALEELSSRQINEFEKEFNVTCEGYSISCGSNRIKYEFT